MITFKDKTDIEITKELIQYFMNTVFKNITVGYSIEWKESIPFYFDIILKNNAATIRVAMKIDEDKKKKIKKFCGYSYSPAPLRPFFFDLTNENFELLEKITRLNDTFIPDYGEKK